MAAPDGNVEKHEEAPMTESGHERGEHTVSLSWRFSGNVEENLDYWILDEAAGDVQFEDWYVGDTVFAYGLQPHQTRLGVIRTRPSVVRIV